MMPTLDRNWAVAAEPAVMGVVSLSGSTLMVLLVPDASSPEEYGGLFVGFLIFLGFGVLGITIFTASYVAKAFVKAMTDMGGFQATKVYGLQTQEQFDARFRLIDQAAAERAEAIVEALDKINDNLTTQTATMALLKQEVQQQVMRADELRRLMQDDVKELQGAVFKGRRPRDTDEPRRTS